MKLKLGLGPRRLALPHVVCTADAVIVFQLTYNRAGKPRQEPRISCDCNRRGRTSDIRNRDLAVRVPVGET